MTVNNATETTPAAAGQHVLKEEAARYALLRRIAPTLRHHLAGTLQPIGMVSAIMERRLQSDQPDLAVLRDNSKSISTLSRTAAGASMNLITWVAPKENGYVAVHEGIEECVGMLSTDLAFRGFNLTNDVKPSDVSTSVFALRSVFTAALIALTDTALTPASIVISCAPADGESRVLITVTPGADAATPESPRGYRKLGWDDVDALASAEKVGLSQAAGRAELRFAAAEHADTHV